MPFFLIALAIAGLGGGLYLERNKFHFAGTTPPPATVPDTAQMPDVTTIVPGVGPVTPTDPLHTAASTLLAKIKAGGMPVHTFVQEVNDFQVAYNATNPSTKLGVDGKYGPLTTTALMSIVSA